MGKKKYGHAHEFHHEAGKAERWLSRETHKMVAEFFVLVLAATTADHLLVALGHALAPYLA